VVDLATQYLGLSLRNPVVASAGPLSQTVDGVRRLADGGVGAVVLYSLFEEQLRHEAARDIYLEEIHEESFAESLTYFPTVPSNDSGLSDNYLRLLEQAAEAVDVPVLGSINGSTLGSWAEFARQMQDAGAAAIELNVYLVPGDVTVDGMVIERRHLDILGLVKEAVSIPVAMKLSPYFSSFGNMAMRLDEAGADGLVLFNRFMQPEVDRGQDRGGLGTSTCRVGGIAAAAHLDRGCVQRHGSASSLAGVDGRRDGADDVVRYLLAGADVVMTTSAPRAGADGGADKGADGGADSGADGGADKGADGGADGGADKGADGGAHGGAGTPA
jgi:dihydroorotate dehydrogenase (fumarate)